MMAMAVMTGLAVALPLGRKAGGPSSACPTKIRGQASMVSSGAAARRHVHGRAALRSHDHVYCTIYDRDLMPGCPELPITCIVRKSRGPEEASNGGDRHWILAADRTATCHGP